MNMTNKAARRGLAFITAVAGVFLLAGSLGAPAAAQPNAIAAGCRPRDDFSSITRDWVIEVASDTDSVMAATRADWGIGVLDSSEIRFIRDPASCRRGARAHAIAAGQDSLSPPSVYLLRIGPTRYLAWNGVMRYGALMQYLFDSSFVLLESLGS